MYRRVLIPAVFAVILVPLTSLAQGNDDKFEVQELRSAQEYQQIVQVAETLVNAGDYYEALLKLIDVTEAGDDSEAYFKDAEFVIGATLFHLNLYQSSYIY
ncbi:MAG: hypothetical protein ACI9OJ_004269, partial [Myxococcota bacterium]